MSRIVPEGAAVIFSRIQPETNEASVVLKETAEGARQAHRKLAARLVDGGLQRLLEVEAREEFGVHAIGEKLEALCFGHPFEHLPIIRG